MNLEVPKAWNWRWAGLLTALVFVAYFPILQTAGWIWDDGDYIVNNPLLHSIEGLRRIWVDSSATPQYYPIVHSTFWFEFQLWGLKPVGFHSVNVFLMVGVALLFWRLLLRLHLPGAWWIAALFAVHPNHVESVAWVTERKNMLSMFFLLAATLRYWSFIETGRWRAYVESLALFAAGLLSKTVIAFMPPALFLLLWWKKPQDLKKHLIPLAALFLAGGWMGWRTAMLEVSQVGAEGAAWAWSVAERFLLAGKILWSYAVHLVAPNPVFLYPKWMPDTSDWMQWMYLVSAVLLPVMLLCFSKRVGRGPLVGMLIFGGALFPALGFLNVYPMKFSFLADHFQFHANLAFFAVVGVLLVKLPFPPRPRIALASLALVGCIGMDWSLAPAYESEQALWEDTVEKNPTAWMAWHNLGGLYAEQRREKESYACYEKAVAIERDPKLLNSMSAWWLRKASRSQWQPRMLRAAADLGAESAEQWPNYYPTQLLLGRIHSFGPEGKWASATGFYLRYLELLSESRLNDGQVAEILMTSGQEAVSAVYRYEGVPGMQKFPERVQFILRKVGSIPHLRPRMKPEFLTALEKLNG